MKRTRLPRLRPAVVATLPSAWVRAAVELVRERGASGLTVASLARSLDVDPEGLWRASVSNDDLLRLVADAGCEQLTARLARARARAGPRPWDPLRAAARAFVAYARDEPHLFDLCAGRDRDRMAAGALDSPDAAADPPLAELDATLERPIRDGLVGPDRSIARLLVQALLYGVAALVRSGGLVPESAADLEDTAEALTVASLGGLALGHCREPRHRRPPS